MGNPDVGSAGERVKNTQDIEPSSERIEDRGGGWPLQYIYPILEKLNGTQVARDLMNEEMRNFLTGRGYKILDNDSDEAAEVLRQFDQEVNQRLEEKGYRTEVKIGTPIVIERGDHNRFPKVNVIFGVAKWIDRIGVQKNILLTHAVDVDVDSLTLNPTYQHLPDGTFDPVLYTIFPGFEFGVRGFFPHIHSYPSTSLTRNNT